MDPNKFARDYDALYDIMQSSSDRQQAERDTANRRIMDAEDDADRARHSAGSSSSRGGDPGRAERSSPPPNQFSGMSNIELGFVAAKRVWRGSKWAYRGIVD